MFSKRKVYCVFGCSELGAYMHRFPHPERRAELFATWLAIINEKLKESDPMKVYKNKRICDYHFQPADKVASHRLIDSAVPSLHFTGVHSSSGISVQLEHNYSLPRLWLNNNLNTKIKVSSSHNQNILDKGQVATVNKPEPSASSVGESICTQFSTSFIGCSKKSSEQEHIAVAADDKVVSERADLQDSSVISDSANDLLDDDAQEDTENQLFSWQKDSEITCDDCDVNPVNTVEKASELKSNVIEEYGDTVQIGSLEEPGLETDNQAINNDEKDLHEGYKCDMCKKEIYRFRYSCVECSNYDLCGACEARAAHSQHYLLRIPRPRPHGEIQVIIDTIRRFLKADPKSLRAEANFVTTLMDEMKSEVLSEVDTDPVPDEPDYPIESEHSSDEHDCEMEERNTKCKAVTQYDAQDVIYLDEDILDWIPQETNKKDINQASEKNKDSHSTSNVHINHKPELRIDSKIHNLSSCNALVVSKSISATYPKTISISKDILKHKLEKRTVNIGSPSTSNLGKVKKRIILLPLPKRALVPKKTYD